MRGFVSLWKKCHSLTNRLLWTLWEVVANPGVTVTFCFWKTGLAFVFVMKGHMMNYTSFPHNYRRMPMSGICTLFFLSLYFPYLHTKRPFIPSSYMSCNHLTPLWNICSQGLSLVQRNAGREGSIVRNAQRCTWWIGVLYMPAPALVFILCNLTELQSDEFKLSHPHAHHQWTVCNNQPMPVLYCSSGLFVPNNLAQNRV